MESNNIDADEPKKKRRSKWDAPATSGAPSTNEGSAVSVVSSAVAAGALITQQQAAEKAFAQQALAQTMMVRSVPMPISMPIAQLSIPSAPSSAAAVNKLDARIYIG